jgi:hypothetical protein
VGELLAAAALHDDEAWNRPEQRHDKWRLAITYDQFGPVCLNEDGKLYHVEALFEK